MSNLTDDQVWNKIDHKLANLRIEQAEQRLMKELIRPIAATRTTIIAREYGRPVEGPTLSDKEQKAIRFAHEVQSVKRTGPRITEQLQFLEARLRLRHATYISVWNEMGNPDEPRLAGVIHRKHLLFVEHQKASIRALIPNWATLPDWRKIEIDCEEALKQIESKWRDMITLPSQMIRSEESKRKRTHSSRASVKTARFAFWNEFKIAGAAIGVKITEDLIAKDCGWTTRSNVTDWKAAKAKISQAVDLTIRRALAKRVPNFMPTTAL